MNVPRFVHGPIANVFTAFGSAGEIDHAGQRAILDFLLAKNACSALFVRSGMGQMYTYSCDDTTQMTRLAVEHVAGRLPVLVGAAGIWDRESGTPADRDQFFRDAVALSRYAEDAGADGVVHTMPEAVQPVDGESPHDVILRYFEMINEAVSLPVFVYQPPPTAPEYRLTVDLIQQLGAMTNIVAAKISTTDAEVLLDSIWAARNCEFAIIAGAETAYYTVLAAGMTAVIGQGCCLNPEILRAECELFRAGERDAALDAQRSVNMLVQQGIDAVAFFKRYAAEQGYKVQSYARGPGGAIEPSLSSDMYAAFKLVLEQEIERFAPSGKA